jgi:hypothetical protein
MKPDPSQIPFDASKSFGQVFSKYSPCPQGLEYSQRYGGNLRDAAAAWNEAPNPEFLLWALEHPCRAEKSEARSFMCWCLRHTPFGDGRLWELLVDERSRRVVEVAERHACGEATDQELLAARLAAKAAFATIAETVDRKAVRLAARAAPCVGIRAAVWDAAVLVVWDTARAAAHAAEEAIPDAEGDVYETTYAAAVKSQADLLRVQYGNPAAPYLAMEDDGQTADRP